MRKIIFIHFLKSTLFHYREQSMQRSVPSSGWHCSHAHVSGEHIQQFTVGKGVHSQWQFFSQTSVPCGYMSGHWQSVQTDEQKYDVCFFFASLKTTSILDRLQRFDHSGLKACQGRIAIVQPGQNTSLNYAPFAGWTSFRMTDSYR